MYLVWLQYHTTINGVLNVSGNSFCNNNAAFISSLSVSGLTTLYNNTTINGVLNVRGNSLFNYIITFILSGLNYVI